MNSTHQIPKAEIHVHLEATITPDLCRKFALRNNVNLSNDSYRFLGGFVGFILGTLFVLIFFGVLLVSLEMNKNIRRILNILENKNNNKTPPEL